MHNSEGGSPVARDEQNNPIEIPYSAALMYSCVGCHSASGSTTWIDSVTQSPIVYNSSAPSYGANGLAGGNFYYVAYSGDDRGHNVLGISNIDQTYGTTPPGGSDMGSQLTCSGVYGCHGRIGSGEPVDQVVAVKYAHHNTTPKTGESSVANDFRFLRGVTGVEDNSPSNGRWEVDNTNSSHNEYKGADGFSGTEAEESISYLCYRCHGYYHDPSGSFAFSHPSNYRLTSYEAGTYNMVTPVARPEDNYSGDPTTVRTGANGDLVMCLSCHRAHASPYEKMMRWNYTDSTDPECLNCHNPVP